MKLRRNSEPVIGGHLIETTTVGRVYNILEKNSRAGCLILDDDGKKIWISKTCKNNFFSEV